MIGGQGVVGCRLTVVAGRCSVFGVRWKVGGGELSMFGCWRSVDAVRGLWWMLTSQELVVGGR